MSEVLPESDSWLDPASPLLLLFVPLRAPPVPVQLRQHLLAALRRAEPRAKLRIQPNTEVGACCHYQLLGSWGRPAAAHAALVFVLSGLSEQGPE